LGEVRWLRPRTGAGGRCPTWYDSCETDLKEALEVLTYELLRCRHHIHGGVLMHVDFLPAGAAGPQIADPIDPPSTGVMHLAGPKFSSAKNDGSFKIHQIQFNKYI
ncbi:MAG: hypothetical protein ACFFD2_08785, partial [Promethearchaeota archaeon]